MNSLSWMLYLADIAGGASALLSVTAAFAAIGAGMSLGAWMIMGPEPTYWSWDDKPAKKAWHEDLRGKLIKAPKPLLVVFVVCALIATIIPGRNTMYAIAASEMGERALTTPTADKAMSALNAWLDRQIDGAGDDRARD